MPEEAMEPPLATVTGDNSDPASVATVATVPSAAAAAAATNIEKEGDGKQAESKVPALGTEVEGLQKLNADLTSLVGQWHASLVELQQAMARQAGYPVPAQQPAAAVWSEHRTAEGHKYWYNASTGQSSWNAPPGRAAPAQALGPRPKGPAGANLFVIRKKRRDEIDNFYDDDLRAAFERFGRLVRAEMSLDKDTGASKGFGFVSYETVEAADAAISTMHGALVGGRQLRVEKTQDDAAAGPTAYGGVGS